MANINQYETRLLTVARSTEPYPVDFDEAWRWVGYARKDSALRTLQENFEEGTDFCLLHNKVEQKAGSGGHNEKSTGNLLFHNNVEKQQAVKLRYRGNKEE
jgi:hypothetical protein